MKNFNKFKKYIYLFFIIGSFSSVFSAHNSTQDKDFEHPSSSPSKSIVNEHTRPKDSDHFNDHQTKTSALEKQTLPTGASSPSGFQVFCKILEICSQKGAKEKKISCFLSCAYVEEKNCRQCKYAQDFVTGALLKGGLSVVRDIPYVNFNNDTIRMAEENFLRDGESGPLNLCSV
jgi:hypothetical protein